METIHEKEEEFAHIILGESREDIFIFCAGNLLDSMDEFIGGDYAVIGPHDLS
jgi:hypothetical protein